jgi:hypothetical protein
LRRIGGRIYGTNAVLLRVSHERFPVGIISEQNPYTGGGKKSHFKTTSVLLLGALEKLRKMTISFAMSVRMELSSLWADFREI